MAPFGSHASAAKGSSHDARSFADSRLPEYWNAGQSSTSLAHAGKLGARSHTVVDYTDTA